MTKIFLLLFCFELKHLFCDWFAQTMWMVEGKARRYGWFFPLFAHAGMHGFWTGALMMAFSQSLSVGAVCGIFDTVCHMFIDRIKSSPNFFGGYKSGTKWFWILLGLDQFFHHLTYFVIIFGWRELADFLRAL